MEILLISPQSIPRKWAFRVVWLMTILNADIILFSLIYFNLVSAYNAFLISLLISLPEIPIWYLCLSRVYLDYIETGKEVLIKNIKRGHFYFYLDLDYWKKRFKDYKNPKSWHLKALIRIIKVLGVYGLFIISAEPFPFGRTFTIISCVIARRPFGLVPIIVGNILHLYWASIIWDGLF